MTGPITFDMKDWEIIGEEPASKPVTLESFNADDWEIIPLDDPATSFNAFAQTRSDYANAAAKAATRYLFDPTQPVTTEAPSGYFENAVATGAQGAMGLADVYNGITTFAKQIAQEWADTRSTVNDPMRGTRAEKNMALAAGRGFEKGVGGMLQGIALAAQGLEESFALATTGRSTGTKASDKATYKVGERVSAGWVNSLREVLDLPVQPDVDRGFLQTTLPEAVGQMGAMLAGGSLVSRGLGNSVLLPPGQVGALQGRVGEALASQAGGVTFSGATLAAGSAYDEVKDLPGFGESDARAYATVAGLIGTLEAVPFAEFPGSFTKFAMSKILTKAPEPVRLAVATKVVEQLSNPQKIGVVQTIAGGAAKAAPALKMGVAESGTEFFQTGLEMGSFEGELKGDLGDESYRKAFVQGLASALGRPEFYEAGFAGFFIGGVMGAMKSYVAKDGTPEQKADYLRTVAPEKAQAIAESTETPSRTDVEAYLPKTKAKEREAIKEALQSTPEPDPAMQDTQRLVDSYMPDLFEGEAEVVAEESAPFADEAVAGEATPVVEPEAPATTPTPPVATPAPPSGPVPKSIAKFTGKSATAIEDELLELDNRPTMKLGKDTGFREFNNDNESMGDYQTSLAQHIHGLLNPVKAVVAEPVKPTKPKKGKAETTAPVAVAVPPEPSVVPVPQTGTPASPATPFSIPPPLRVFAGKSPREIVSIFKKSPPESKRDILLASGVPFYDKSYKSLREYERLLSKRLFELMTRLEARALLSPDASAPAAQPTVQIPSAPLAGSAPSLASVTQSSDNSSTGAPTDGILRAARRPAPQQAGPTQSPHFAPQAITRTGKKLLRQVKAGKIGRRTIASFIRKMSRGVLYIGRQNVSGRFPAYYMSTFHAIAMQSPDDIQVAVHESGHALSAALEGSNPGYRAGKDAELIALAKQAGAYASAQTPEEGVAELYRRMVLNLPADPALVAWLEGEIQKFSPRFFNEYRDAANLWQTFTNLSRIEKARANNADGRRPYTDEFGTSSYILRWSGRLAGSFLNARFLGYGVNGMLYRTLRGDKIYEEIRREEGIAAALKWRFGPISKQLRKQALEAHRAIRDGAADVAQTQNALLLHMADVQQAVEGSGVRQGVNFVQYKDGFAGFDLADIQALEAAFGRPMPLSSHGSEVNLFPMSLAKIRAEVGFDNWQDFQDYTQWKTVEYRYRLRVQQIKDGTKTEPYVYPGYDSDMPPWALRQTVADYEAQYPSFIPGYKDITDYSDSLMLLSVLSGELSVAEAIRIKNANEEYVPLGRNLEAGGMGIGPATSPLEINSGIKAANGSIAPFGNLQAILEQKTRRAYGAYYTHMFMNSMLEAQRFATVEATRNDPGRVQIPLDQMADVSRLMIPLGMRTVLDTDITDEKLLEVSTKALKAINALRAQAGEPPLTITPKEVQTQINSIKFWGTDKPNGANVVAVFDPELKNHEFYYIPDPMLFKQASFVNLKPNAGVRVWGDLMRGMNQPMKRVLTNNLAFAAWNVLVRDQVTAVMNAKTFRGRIPFYLTAYGLLNRLGVWKVPVGMTPNKWVTELGTIQLAGTHSAVNSNQGRALATQFFAQLGEGFEYNNWQDKTPYEKLIAIWGNAWAGITLPATAFNVFTGGPQVAALAESLTRQGAALEVLRTGGTQMEAMRQANEITGSFGTSGLDPNMRQIFAGSFFSASITSALELVFTMSDPDPKVGGIQTTLTKGAIITATFGMLALAVYMAMSLLRDDEWIKEWARNERDRPDQSRWREMNIFGFRAPFGYGPGGVLASLAYNGVLNAILVDDPIEMRSNAVAIATQFTNLPDIQAVIPPVLNAFVEQGLNWKFYAGRPIVPGYMMLGPTAEELKYYPDTTELYQEIGAGLGVSPLRVQHAVEGVMGRNVGQLVKMIDQMNLGVEVNPSNYPVIGSLITNEQPTLYTDSIQKLRLQADLFKQAEDTINKWGERTDRQAEVAVARKILAETKKQSERYGEVLAWYSKSKDAETPADRAAALMKMVDVARSFFDVSDEGKEPHTLFTDEYIKKRVRVLQRAEDWTKPGYKELMEQKENAVLELQRLGGDGYRQRLGRLSFGAPEGGLTGEQILSGGINKSSDAAQQRFDAYLDRIMSVGLSGTPGGGLTVP